MRLDISSTVPQAQYHQLPHKYRLFVGGFGTGKTQTMLDAALIDAMTSSTAVIGLYSPTHDLNRIIHAPRLKLELDKYGINYRHNQQSGQILTSNSGVGDFILRSLDSPERIVGYETYASHVDELDTLRTDHAKHAFQQIDARNRQNINGKTNRIGVYTTPEGFKFVYNRWVEEPTPEFGFVQASSRSNPFLPPGYIDSLMANYPVALRDAYIEGKFVNLTSGTIYTSYSVLGNDCRSEYIDGERVYIGMDFNIGNMSAVALVKRDNEYHAIEEFTGILDTTTMAQLIRKRFQNSKITVYPDASGNSRSTSSKNTDFSLLEKEGLSVVASGSNPRVKDRVNTLNNALEKRTFKINRINCKVVSNNLLQQAWKNGEPDKSSGNDHTNDAVGYAVYNLLPLIKPVITPMMRFG